MRTPAELTERFRAEGLKVTPQRQCIFRALHDNTRHPSAESVYAIVSEQMPTISLRTVYQTLNDLAAMGELTLLDLGTGASRFDPNLDPHHHLVCDGCGKVLDVYADVAGVRVPSASRQGFTIDSTQVVFRGTCAECAAGAAGGSSVGSAPQRASDPSSHQLHTNHQEEHNHA